MFNTRDSETPYRPPSTKPFKEQMDEWLKWCNEHPEEANKALKTKNTNIVKTQ